MCSRRQPSSRPLLSIPPLSSVCGLRVCVCLIAGIGQNFLTDAGSEAKHASNTLEALALNKQNTLPPSDQIDQKPPPEAATEQTSKKQFVEPTISVPADVLEATTFFQAPTIESATT